MNNEPVGKVVQYDNNGSLEHAWFGEPPPVGTLLYTHPEKELTLTRDEIRDVWREFPASFTLTPLTIEFARAILRKASEK